MHGNTCLNNVCSTRNTLKGNSSKPFSSQRTAVFLHQYPCITDTICTVRSCPPQTDASQSVSNGVQRRNEIFYCTGVRSAPSLYLFIKQRSSYRTFATQMSFTLSVFPLTTTKLFKIVLSALNAWLANTSGSSSTQFWVSKVSVLLRTVS